MTDAEVIGVALAKHRAGQTREARSIASGVWSRTGAWQAAALLALIELDVGHVRDALDWTSRAIAVDPRRARLRVQAGRLQVQLGMPDIALASFRVAADLDPTLGAPWLEAGHCHALLGDVTQAAKAFCRATQFAHERDAAMQALLDVLPARRVASPSTAQVPPTEREAISIITCSVDDARFARVSASFSHALADWPHEIVRIDTCWSVAQGLGVVDTIRAADFQTRLR